MHRHSEGSTKGQSRNRSTVGLQEGPLRSGNEQGAHNVWLLLRRPTVHQGLHWPDERVYWPDERIYWPDERIYCLDDCIYCKTCNKTVLLELRTRLTNRQLFSRQGRLLIEGFLCLLLGNSWTLRCHIPQLTRNELLELLWQNLLQRGNNL